MLKDALESQRETIANYDPLMWAHWSIVDRIAKHAPEVVLVDGCPLCWVAGEHEQHCVDAECAIIRQTFEDWIPGVAAAAAERGRRLAREAAGP